MYPKIDSFIKFGNPTGITGKRDGSTNSEVIFPDGLLRAGSVCDELYEDKAIKRVGRVDLGTLNYGAYVYGSKIQYQTTITGGTSRNNNNLYISANYVINDAAADNKNTLYHNIYRYYGNNLFCFVSACNLSRTEFKESMSGQYLYYELETPITYTLDTPLDLSYKVDDFGTESILGANVSTINTTKFNGNIKYALNAADTVRNLQTNYVSTYENQGLDEERKANARKNIGVDGIIDKADKSGIYPDLVAGNLVDEKNTGSSQVIMGLRTSCGTDSIVDDGYAQIKRIKGNSIVWNQLANNVYNIYFNKTNTGSSMSYPTISSNNAMVFNGIKKNDKLYYIWNVTYDTSIHTEIYANGHGQYAYCYSNHYGSKYITTATANISTNVDLSLFRFNPGETCSGTCTLQAFNLSKMFGPGNEPSTAEEFDTLFPHIK